jgi:hypothetical protein
VVRMGQCKDDQQLGGAQQQRQHCYACVCTGHPYHMMGHVQ